VVNEKMKIINNFPFRNEFDLLEIRLSTEYDYVDQFTIVECDHTYTGIYKGFNLPEQMERYAPWWDKVRYVQVGKPPGLLFDAEHWIRNHFQSTWDGLTKDDVVVINDCDELIRPETYKFIRETDYDFYRLGMPFFNFKFNYLNIQGHTPWPSVKAFRGYFVEGHDGMRNIPSVPGGRQIELDHAGWHFSYLGDTDWVLEKINSISHPENNTDSVRDNLNVDNLISQGKDFASRPGFVFCPVKLDEYFPKVILDNKSKYSNYILPNGDRSVSEHFSGDWPKVLSGINNF